MKWLVFVIGYVAGFVWTGRVAYVWAGSRPRTYEEINEYRTGGTYRSTKTRTDDNDRTTAFFLALFWPFVVAAIVAFQSLRFGLLHTIYRETPAQRLVRQAIEHETAMKIFESNGGHGSIGSYVISVPLDPPGDDARSSGEYKG